jgi:hypothetical protein
MIQGAKAVGELVRALAERGAEGRVSREFGSSVYIRTGEKDFILLLRGGLRSPMTVNIGGCGDLREVVSVGERFTLDRQSLSSSGLSVKIGRACIHRSRLMGSESICPVAEGEIVWAAKALGLLYSVSAAGLSLAEGKPLEDFVKEVLLPFARGDSEEVCAACNYSSLIGSGAGFTPAGDDFVTGFVSSFNHAAHAVGTNKVVLRLGELSAGTVQESASIIDYAQRGYVDEGLENLILASFGGAPRPFRDGLLDLADRGHTSGLDMSLGVLLAVAAVRDHWMGGHALKASFNALRSSQAWNPLIGHSWAAH